mmetsp:Transcript_6975/g.12766  ORF Transcript_6975/g.12766 Transcript_6975/m.12766 type:complete len:93 (-) Transcript_6975:3806-4084(-)
MTKGTYSMGRRHTKSHMLCKRCGRRAFHIQKDRCSACGYPDAKTRAFGWALKVKRRKGQGTGRMRYLKTLHRRAKNGFRSGTVPTPRTKHVK